MSEAESELDCEALQPSATAVFVELYAVNLFFLSYIDV